MNETTYYQDKDNFVPQRVSTDSVRIDVGLVTVEKGMLRVGNDTHTLIGVSESSLVLSVERRTFQHKKEIQFRRMGIVLCCIVAVIGAISGYYLLLLFLGLAMYVGYGLEKAKAMDEVCRFVIARLILKRGGIENPIIIGSWSDFINDELGTKLERIKHRNKNEITYYNELYAKEKSRAEAIAKAVGSAIVDGSCVKPEEYVAG